MPAGLSFSVALRRVALAAGMTQEEIDDVMVRLRTKEAGELRTPREWGSIASTAIMSAMSAHRIGTKPPKTTPEPAVVDIEPEAAPAVAVEEPDWSGEWDGPLNIVPEVLVTVQPEPIVADEDHAPEIEMMETPKPAEQPIAAPAAERGVAATSKRNPARKRSDPSTLTTSPGIRADRKVVFLRVVAADETLSKSAVRVAIPLFDRINAEVGHSFISMNRLGKEAAMGWRSVQRAINELEDAGYIAVDRIEGEAHHIAIRRSKFEGAKLNGDQKTASRESGRGKVEGDTPAKTDRGSAKRDDVGEGADIPPTPAKTDRGTPAKTDRGPLSELAPVLSDRAVMKSSEKENVENEAADATPVRVRTGFDRDWLTFKDAYPAYVDDQWRPLFMRVRSDGWSLDQLLEGIEHVRSTMCEGQVFHNVAAFLGREMWADADPHMKPEHHEHEDVPMGLDSFVDLDSASIPF